MTNLRSPYTFAHQPSWLAETTAVTARLVDPFSICHPPIVVVVTNSSLGRLIPPSPLLRDPLHNARPHAPLERESDPRPNDVAARPPFCLSLPGIGVRRELIMAKWCAFVRTYGVPALLTVRQVPYRFDHLWIICLVSGETSTVSTRPIYDRPSVLC